MRTAPPRWSTKRESKSCPKSQLWLSKRQNLRHNLRPNPVQICHIPTTTVWTSNQAATSAQSSLQLPQKIIVSPPPHWLTSPPTKPDKEDSEEEAPKKVIKIISGTVTKNSSSTSKSMRRDPTTGTTTKAPRSPIILITCKTWTGLN